MHSLLLAMRESLMLSSLTVGEKQHPRLGGCVRVFFQLFDWNRRLACKTRIFAQKQLPSERPNVRRPFTKYTEEGSGEIFSVSNEDAQQTLLIETAKEEDNLRSKQDCSCKEAAVIIGGEGVREESIDGGMQETAVVSAGFCREKNSSNNIGSGFQVKSPGVIAKLMGLDSLPSPADTHTISPECESLQKGFLLATNVPLPNAPEPQDVSAQINLQLEHGMPHDELNALLAELINGNMSNIVSALPPFMEPHSHAQAPRPTTTSPHPISTPQNPLPVLSSAYSPSPSAFTLTKSTVTSGDISSPLCRTHLNRPCPTDTTSAHDGASARMGSVLVSPCSLSADTVDQTCVDMRSSSRLQKRLIARQAKSKKSSSLLAGGKSFEGQPICEKKTLSEFEQQMIRSPKLEGRSAVGTVKGGKKMKRNSTPSCVGTQQTFVNAGIHSARMEMDVQGSLHHEEGGDVWRTTCKSLRRKKVDTPSQYRIVQEGAGSHPSGHPAIPCKTSEESCNHRRSPKDQTTDPPRKSVAAAVRVSPNDQSSCSLASSTNSAAACHKRKSPSTEFTINYNVSFFDEYHKRSDLVSADKCSEQFNGDDLVTKPLEGNAARREAVADHDRKRSLNYSKPASNSTAAAKEQETFSLIRLLINRRAARKAAATAAMQAAGVLRTALPVLLDIPADYSCATAADSLQSLVSSCTVELEKDPNRREKLSAGRSEAGGVDFMHVMQPLSYGAECCTAESVAEWYYEPVRDEGEKGDSNDPVMDGWRRLPGLGNGAMVQGGLCTRASSLACERSETSGKVKGTTGGAEESEEIMCKTQLALGKNTTAAILQEVVSAVSTPASSCSRPRPHHGHHNDHLPPQFHTDEDDANTTSTAADGHDTESTSSAGCCWARAGQPSPVSVLISPFDDDVSTAGEDSSCWIQSEEDYVAAVLASTSENGETTLPSAELFGKLEERVIAAWPDSEVAPTRGYRRLIFECVREAVAAAVAAKDGKGSRRWRARVLFEEMCRWRQEGARDAVLDDLVAADLQKACNRWVAFQGQSRDIALLLDRTIFDLLVEELVCDLVLA